MTTSYLLPCSCGRKVPVEPRQAGQVVRCSCGASLEVPTLLEMAALEGAEPEAGARRPPRPWGVRQGLALLGAVIFLGALVLVIFLLRAQPRPPFPDKAEMDPGAVRREAQRLTPLQSRRIWQSLRARGPDGRMPREEQYQTDKLGRYQEDLLRWRLSMGVVLTIAVAGLSLVVIPLLRK